MTLIDDLIKRIQAVAKGELIPDYHLSLAVKIAAKHNEEKS